MKKIGVLFLVLFLVLSFVQLFNVQAQEIPGVGDIEETIENIEDTKEDIEDNIEDIKEGKWEYLGKEWKEMILKNKFFTAIDGFFTKISFVFKIFFGEFYSLSLSLVFVILLWFYFLFKFVEIFRDYSSFSNGVAIVLGLAFNIIFAQLQVLKKIVDFFGWLVFTQEANIWRFLILLGIFAGMIFSYYLTSHLGEVFKKSKAKTEKEKEKMEKEMEKKDRAFLHMIAEKLKGVFKKNEK
jgi:hypothetical protein